MELYPILWIIFLFVVFIVPLYFCWKRREGKQACGGDKSCSDNVGSLCHDWIDGYSDCNKALCGLCFGHPHKKNVQRNSRENEYNFEINAKGIRLSWLQSYRS